MNHCTRAQEIAETIEIVAKYFGVDPHKVLTSTSAGCLSPPLPAFLEN
jgi:hypothetical protein